MVDAASRFGWGRGLGRATFFIFAATSYSPAMIWAGNVPFITAPWRLLQVVVVASVGLVVLAALIGWPTGQWYLIGSSFLVLILMVMRGGAFVQRFEQPFGILIWVAAAMTVGWIMFRLRSLRATAVSLQLVSFYLLAAPLLLGLVAVSSSEAGTPQAGGVTVEPGTRNGADLVVIVLDGYAGWVTLEREFDSTQEIANDLKKAGFVVPELAWSPYTMTMLSLPSIFDLSYPIEAGDFVLEADVSHLADVTSGSNNLVKTLKAVGYQYTHIESGWYGMNCGPLVDNCRRGPLFDDMVGTAFSNSIFTGLGLDPYGTVLEQGTRNTMEQTEQTLQEAGGNNRPDLIVAHVLAPHPPYVFGQRCEVLRDSIGSMTVWSTESGTWSPGQLKAAYIDQLGCVNHWLTNLVAIVDSVPTRPAIVITGDHGTGFRQQMERPIDTWVDLDIFERLNIMLAMRTPTPCQLEGLTTPIDAIATIIGCLTGADIHTTRRHYLVSDSSIVVPIDPADLDAIGAR
jgi:hypothetical protein